jgi:hypothetical protein
MQPWVNSVNSLSPPDAAADQPDRDTTVGNSVARLSHGPLS